MEEAKLIRIFKKYPIQEDYFQGDILALVITLLLLPLLSTQVPWEWRWPVLLGFLIFTGILVVNYFWCYSIFMVFDQYIICYYPLFFWMNKKLFLYEKVDYIHISKESEGQLYLIGVKLRDNQCFNYMIDAKYIYDFVIVLKNQKVNVKMYNPSLKEYDFIP